jgi:hypothetical protein
MNTAAWACTVTGIGLLGLVALDVYRTILHSSGRSRPVTEALTRADLSAVFLIGLAGSAHQAWSANLYSTASVMFPKHAVASLIGLGSAAGMIFPIVTGLLLDKFTAADNVTGGYTVLFIWAFAYLVAFGLTICARPVSRNCQLPSWRMMIACVYRSRLIDFATRRFTRLDSRSESNPANIVSSLAS